MDELKEIAAWIQQHPKDAAALNAKVNDIDNTIQNYTPISSTEIDTLFNPIKE